MPYHTTKYPEKYSDILTRNIDISKGSIESALIYEIGDFDTLKFIIDKYLTDNVTIYLKEEAPILECVKLIYENDNIQKFNGYENDIMFDLIIANPPYSLGNKIISEAIKHLKDDGKASVLMPLSQYKKQELYRHIEKFELADPKLFNDVAITKNLCICKLKKEPADIYTLASLILASVDQSFIEYYKWNIKNSIGLTWKGANYKEPNAFCIDTDVIDCSRWINEMKGSGYHPKGDSSFAYCYNILYEGYEKIWKADLAYLRLGSRRAKDNFCKFAYNYSSNKRDCLESKIAAGIKKAHANEECFFIVPQIDWEHIDVNQKELWDKGDYDNAVLAEMGLKWNDDKTKIVKA